LHLDPDHHANPRVQEAEASPSPPPVRVGRSASISEPESDVEGEDYNGESTEDGSSSHDQMVKKLVRLALASEYSRQPLRRSDITAKGGFDGHSHAAGF
jgi:melanoma-associated antigen